MAFWNQRVWRVLGALALAACGGMALYGRQVAVSASPKLFVVYWAGFLFFLVLALGIAMIDLRYARRQYIKERDELYRETLGDEAFRRQLSEAHRKIRPDPPKDK
ncbi:MAG: hypothetical protein RBU21_03130 [FCB group bacterium]|nr:hypothetical protein [FCB group bacterium]